MPSTSEMMMLENSTDGILKWDKHCASGEKARAQSRLWQLSFSSHWMRNFPRWVMLTEERLEHSFRLPLWAPAAGHSLFLPGSEPAHSVTPCACHTPRQDLIDLSTRWSFFLSQKSAHLLNIISIKKEHF